MTDSVHSELSAPPTVTPTPLPLGRGGDSDGNRAAAIPFASRLAHVSSCSRGYPYPKEAGYSLWVKYYIIQKMSTAVDRHCFCKSGSRLFVYFWSVRRHFICKDKLKKAVPVSKPSLFNLELRIYRPRKWIGIFIIFSLFQERLWM
jgi:hypothetical protein